MPQPFRLDLIRLDYIRLHYSTRPYTAQLYTALLDSKTALVSIIFNLELNFLDKSCLELNQQSSVHACSLTFMHFRLLDYQLWTTQL